MNTELITWWAVGLGTALVMAYSFAWWNIKMSSSLFKFLTFIGMLSSVVMVVVFGVKIMLEVLRAG